MMRVQTRVPSGWLGLALGLVTVFAPQASAQCPPGAGCTEYLGKGSKGSYFRILVPDPWDGDLVIVNHGLELDPLTIAPHNTCKSDPDTPCSSDTDCAAVPPRSCNKITLLGLDGFLLPSGKAVAASTFSQTSWSAFQSRYDLKDIIKFMRKKGPGRPKRIVVTGISGGGAVTVDATMHLKPGKLIHGAIPLCSCSGGGLPSMDGATDVRLVYDWVCDGVPGGTFSSLPDVGDPTMSQIDFAVTANTCLGLLAPSADPVEAAAQRARRETLFALTKFPGTATDFVTVIGFAILAMGDFVDDPERLNGRRLGWNEGLDYTSVLDSSAAQAFNDAVPRFGPGKGRRKMSRSTYVDFTRGVAKRVDYPLLSFSGREDFICLPEFQKMYADAAALGEKKHAMIWGSTGGHCSFTPQELRSVFEAYFAWLDTFDTAVPSEPTTADVLARCLSLPGATSSQCNFDTAFTAPPLAHRFPARADWPEAARNPLP